MPYDAILSTFGLTPSSDLTENEVLRLVKMEIARMLATDRARLINLAYRLDIDERRFEQCFRDGQDNDEIASHLAHLFFEREKDKFLHRHNHAV